MTSDPGFPFAKETSSSSLTSRATYFVPAAPPGARVQSAKLRVQLSGFGDLSRVTLNGKSPVIIDIPSCDFCPFWATWNFTDEVRALAARGGGDFHVTPDPIPGASKQSFFTHIQGASYQFFLAANYPWRHGNEDHALTLTFEDDCPRELTLSLSTDTVGPVMPRNQVVAAGLTGTGTEALVEARVKSCPVAGQTPTPVEVTFDVRPPGAEVPLDHAHRGGHQHRVERTTGVIQDLDRGQLTDRCLVDKFDDAGVGSCTVVYRAGDVSGVETIVALAADYPEAQKPITVRLHGFAVLPPNPSRYVLVGAPSNHVGTNDPCRSPAPDSQHELNHFGKPNLVAAVQRIAEIMVQKAPIRIRVNDMSLPWGGLFDITNTWRPPHQTHRTGRNADIEFSGVREGTCVAFTEEQLNAIAEAISLKTGSDPYVEPNHFHISVP